MRIHHLVFLMASGLCVGLAHAAQREDCYRELGYSIFYEPDGQDIQMTCDVDRRLERHKPSMKAFAAECRSAMLRLARELTEDHAGGIQPIRPDRVQVETEIHHRRGTHICRASVRVFYKR